MEKLKTRRWQITIVAVVIIASLASYGLYETFFKPPPPPMRLIVSKNAEADTLDPALSGMIEAGRVYQTVFDSYLTWDLNNELHPWLAESWEWSPDMKTLTLSLRRDVKFHCGRPFNATVLKYSLDRIMDPATRSYAAAQLAEVDKVEILETYKVAIRLKAPNRFFLGYLTGGAIGSPVCPYHAERLGKDFGTSGPCGTGPFKFKEWRRDDYVALVKNKDYNWAPKFTKHTGPAKLDELIFRVIPEDVTRVSDLRTPGGAHMVTNVPPKDVEKLKADPNTRILTAPLSQVFFLSMNTQRMADIKIRQAVAHAIDRDAINKALFYGLYQLAYNPLNPAMGVWYQEKPKTAKLLDLKRAAELLDEAGWKLGSDGYRYKNGKILELTGIGYLGLTQIDILVIIQDQLKKVGIKLKIDEYRGDRQGWYTRCTEGTFDLNPALWAYIVPSLEWFFFARQIPWPNWMRFNDPEFEELVTTGKIHPDEKKALESYHKAVERLIDQAAWAPTFYPVDIVAIRKNVLDYSLPTRQHNWMFLAVTIAS